MCQTCFSLATSLDIPALFPSENKQSPIVIGRIAKYKQLCLKQQLSSSVLVARNAKATGEEISNLSVWKFASYLGRAALLALNSTANQDLRHIWKLVIGAKADEQVLEIDAHCFYILLCSHFLPKSSFQMRMLPFGTEFVLKLQSIKSNPERSGAEME